MIAVKVLRELGVRTLRHHNDVLTLFVSFTPIIILVYSINNVDLFRGGVTQLDLLYNLVKLGYIFSVVVDEKIALTGLQLLFT